MTVSLTLRRLLNCSVAAALLFHGSAAWAGCGYYLSAKQMMFQVLQKRDIVNLYPADHGMHYTRIPTDSNWDILVQWRDPYPSSVTAGQTVSLGLGAQVKRADKGAVGAGIYTFSTGTAVWHVVHQGNAGAGRSGSTGQLYNGSDTSVYDLCNSNDAKPQVLIDVFLEADVTKVHLARYIYTRQEVGSSPAPPRSPTFDLYADTALTGTTLTYLPRPTARDCEANCGNDARCQGFTWIAAGTYNRTDAAMCYLIAPVTGQNPVRGHVSGVRKR